MKILLILLFPICAFGQVYKADLYTMTVNKDGSVCEHQTVVWGPYQYKGIDMFCFSFVKTGQAHCFKLGKHLEPAVQGEVVIAVEDKDGRPYAVRALSTRAGFTIWVTAIDKGFPSWIMSTSRVCVWNFNQVTFGRR